MIIYIEDLICRLACADQYMFKQPISLYSGDASIIESFGHRIEKGIGLTEKQENLAIKFCKKYRDKLTLEFGSAVDSLIDNPKYRLTRSVAGPSTASIRIEDKKILVSFPYNEAIIAKLRSFRGASDHIEIGWSTEKRAWLLDLEETSVLWLVNNLIDESTTVSEEFKELSQEILQAVANIENHAPTLVEENGNFRFVNVHNSVPQPTDIDVKRAFLLARRYGITVWNENALNLLKKEKNSSIFMDFLNKTDLKPLKINSGEVSIDQFSDLINYNLPVLIIVPGLNELSHVKKWTEWLKRENFDENSISVLFRLNNNVNSNFNIFVKENNLNAPLTKNTKAVFISQKIPKPLLSSGIQFNLIINLGEISGVHYSLSNYVDSCPDVVQYTEKEL